MDQNEHPAASRRGFLRSGGMAALAGIASAASALDKGSAASDVTLSLIAEQRRLWDTLQTTEDDARYAAADDREIVVHELLCTTPPTSIVGVIALAKYLEGYQPFREGDYGPDCKSSWQSGVATIARALGSFAGVDSDQFTSQSGVALHLADLRTA